MQLVMPVIFETTLLWLKLLCPFFASTIILSGNNLLCFCCRKRSAQHSNLWYKTLYSKNHCHWESDWPYGI